MLRGKNVIHITISFCKWECLQLFATGNKKPVREVDRSHHLARSNVLFQTLIRITMWEINMNLKLQLKILSFLQFCRGEVG